MSKAFTKEDDDGGFVPPSASALAGVPAGPFRLTSTGATAAASHVDERVRDAFARAETLPRITDPERASLGVTVVVEAADGTRRRFRLVSPEERALLGDGCSVEGPIGRVLLGAEIGDVREASLPRGIEELTIVALEGEPEPRRS